ncbi:MAG TPA: hypothetical protein VGQ05_14480 [Streptosporangiaceae bacterium]|nr:hypothetical protein [Streptosporangiaceae bacterium]
MHDTNASVAASYNPAGGVNAVTTLSPGEWLVRLAGPGPAAQPGGMQATAMDPGAKVCNLNTVWATSAGSAVVRDVNCYLPSGAMDPTQSLVSYDTNS